MERTELVPIGRFYWMVCLSYKQCQNTLHRVLNCSLWTLSMAVNHAVWRKPGDGLAKSPKNFSNVLHHFKLLVDGLWDILIQCFWHKFCSPPITCLGILLAQEYTHWCISSHCNNLFLNYFQTIPYKWANPQTFLSILNLLYSVSRNALKS